LNDCVAEKVAAMTVLKIYTYETEKETGSETLINTITFALPIVRILAKHMPDRLIHMIDTAAAERQSLSINPKVIARFIEEVTQELEQHYGHGKPRETMIEMLFHDAERTDANGDKHPVETRMVVAIEEDT
jgi:hypothetical protein